MHTEIQLMYTKKHTFLSSNFGFNLQSICKFETLTNKIFQQKLVS